MWLDIAAAADRRSAARAAAIIAALARANLVPPIAMPETGA
jgi:hypothetical protein